MPRFYFDIHDGVWSRDDVGVECRNIEEACRHAKRTLPAMALDSIPRDGDRHTITVMVTNDDRRTVYAATLTFSGLLVDR
ncbi:MULTISPECIES: hypothetical protein [Methylobacterium]|uniref:DUF6894 domain-containing protein n=2 Tax=Methylobacterium TaxID=407 RepID=A0A0C6FIH1_9HYPH|nr:MULTISPECIES: hypothetical protein [Methylobacterium]BAQ48298.1 hypothetical protein Maq22A_c27330 [Methylobacterium aquaticum]SFE89237.1 hypothetical protein SAMN04487844_10787 [Methylobacterium sp. yr596]